MPLRARMYIGSSVTSCAVELHAAGVGRRQADRHVERRRLAGAVRARAGRRPRRTHLEADAADDRPPAVGLGEVVGAQRRHRRSVLHRRCTRSTVVCCADASLPSSAIVSVALWKVNDRARRSACSSAAVVVRSAPACRSRCSRPSAACSEVLPVRRAASPVRETTSHRPVVRLGALQLVAAVGFRNSSMRVGRHVALGAAHVRLRSCRSRRRFASSYMKSSATVVDGSGDRRCLVLASSLLGSAVDCIVVTTCTVAGRVEVAGLVVEHDRVAPGSTCRPARAARRPCRCACDAVPS